MISDIFLLMEALGNIFLMGLFLTLELGLPFCVKIDSPSVLLPSYRAPPEKDHLPTVALAFEYKAKIIASCLNVLSIYKRNGTSLNIRKNIGVVIFKMDVIQINQ